MIRNAVTNAVLGIAIVAATASLSAAQAADTASQKFIKDAVQGNLAEVAVGKLAQEKGATDGVRSFGQMLVTDHTAANTKATEVAGQLGVQAPSEPNAKQKKVYNKLSKLSGAAFDRAFARAMVEDHSEDIKAFEKETKVKADNDPAVAFAKDALPTLHKHLDAARALRNGKTARMEH